MQPGKQYRIRLVPDFKAFILSRFGLAVNFYKFQFGDHFFLDDHFVILAQVFEERVNFCKKGLE